MREKWPDRVFRFDTPITRMPYLLERLRGTPARIEEKLRGVSARDLQRRIGQTWSAQENIGHLVDLEELHIGRLDDYTNGAATLRAADITNQRTWDAHHNDTPLACIVEEFRDSRARFVHRLETWDPDRLECSAMHPRLKVPMRVIDLAYFTAEHDDYHLARVHELLMIFQGEAS